ncbi:TPA: hypothetical protein PXM39_003609 [Yersinia enterocolitica]|nr:hypothetical protein [Yersinia enterocolitica]HDL6901002.1 hypothetical protein [Yersinia enterocolitica]HDL7092108.1 hypothetical protein [Yersinia enterocolitica]HDL7101146.1 hypothetical protein [Yersinia enterocolitica]HDL7135628.1 hypothetical protein [Yersinia enterocolitica]
MTKFDVLARYGNPHQHKATFKIGVVEYEVYFTQITKDNPYDCAVEFPKGFNMPDYVHHYDVVFDTKQNRLNNTNFQRVSGLPPEGAIKVLNCVVRIIVDHYNRFRVGLYTYAPADFKLSSVYCRLIAKKKHVGSSIEVGLEPLGRAHVLRTPNFYDKA